MRRKGELSAVAIDRGWPHQVVLPARLCERGGYNDIHEFCRDLTLCSRGHALYHDGQWFHVYCFKDQRTRKNSWRDLAARSSIVSAAAAPTGDVEKNSAPTAGTLPPSRPRLRRRLFALTGDCQAQTIYEPNGNRLQSVPGISGADIVPK